METPTMILMKHINLVTDQMNPKVLSNVKTRSDFSFCFPYLASLEALDVKEMPKESPPKKRQRC